MSWYLQHFDLLAETGAVRETCTSLGRTRFLYTQLQWSVTLVSVTLTLDPKSMQSYCVEYASSQSSNFPLRFVNNKAERQTVSDGDCSHLQLCSSSFCWCVETQLGQSAHSGCTLWQQKQFVVMNTITSDKNDFHSTGYYDRCTALTVHWLQLKQVWMGQDAEPRSWCIHQCVCMMGESCRTKCCRTDCVEGLMWPVMNASSLFQQELCFLLFSGNNNDFILCSGFTLHKENVKKNL